MDVELAARTIEAFGAGLTQVGDEDLRRPTPCERWAVQDLLCHVVEVATRLAGHLAGTPPAGPEPWQPQDRERVYGATTARLVDLLASSDEERPLRLPEPLGERSVGDLVEIYVTDTSIHSWDLARALGRDVELDADVVSLVLSRVRRLPSAARGPGKAFGAHLEGVPRRPAPLDEVLRLSGRDPQWVTPVPRYQVS